MRTWSLPEYIEDLLPADARKLERLRRIALDHFDSHGYELVMPPLLEYIESLLSGTGNDLDLATFKLVDQLSGRTMGVRADTTPQVARIDAHLLNRQGITRLCYAGSVLHTLPAGLGKSRQPFQAGAELYGHSGLEADLEIQQLMLDCLDALGVADVQLDVGHPAICRLLIEPISAEAGFKDKVIAAIETKDVPTLHSLAPQLGEYAEAILQLPTLAGGVETLAHARARLPHRPEIVAALDALASVCAHFSAQGKQVSIDLSELGGFNYESGITFSAYARGAADAIARGGRYDEVGKAFGRARPATGFSMDLRAILSLVTDSAPASAVLAPLAPDAAAQQAIAALRRAGTRVIAQLPGHEAHLAELGCDRILKYIDGRWTVVSL